ncbi:MAG: transporter substrate-binding domain-containing protein, partial [Oscillospiraceae bacterium]|nr:transporter substrate-binding domain-containing protein [Oscillospiraceae bacterium]
AVIAGMTIDPERALEVDFSIPYFNATQVMIVREDSTITKAEDMKGQRIAVIQGYTGQMAVDKLGEGYSYEAFKKGPDAMLELKNNKCDVVVIDSITAYKYVAETDGLKIVVDNNAFEGEQYGIAVKKGNTELLNMINASLQKMLDDGTIDRLAAQYAEEE